MWMIHIILEFNDLAAIKAFKVFLDRWFKLKDIGDLKFFLGLEIARPPKGVTLSQHSYALQMLLMLVS